MWIDADDSFEQLFCYLTDHEGFPAICPICQKKQAHIYMQLYNDITRRGGLWIWCSACRAFLHGSVYVPMYWRDCQRIELDKLTAKPTYLESLKDAADEHINLILTEIPRGIDLNMSG